LTIHQFVLKTISIFELKEGKIAKLQNFERRKFRKHKPMKTVEKFYFSKIYDAQSKTRFSAKTKDGTHENI